MTGENLKNPVHSKPSLEIYGNPRGGAARAPCIDFLPVIGTVPPYDFLNLYGVFDSRFSTIAVSCEKRLDLKGLKGRANWAIF